MLNDKTIAVVVPAFNEEKQIRKVIESMPKFVDRIVIVNDNSTDQTKKVIKDCIIADKSKKIDIKDIYNQVQPNEYNWADMVAQENLKKELKHFAESETENLNEDSDRIILIHNKINTGVGGAIARGYKWCKDHAIDCTAVMAGDGQMDPSELEKICMPVVRDNVDYVKGNRLIHRSSWLVIPKIRYFGNSILSILTKIASGYWHVSDTQTGYTAISKSALNAIRLHKIYNSYGMPNDMLVKLNIAMCTIKEVEIKPVYNIGEQSKMKVFKVIPKISWLLFKSFFKRLWIKYMFRDFHPLFVLYNSGFLLSIVNLRYLYFMLYNFFMPGLKISNEYLLIFIFLSISSIQFILFAMWMDIQDNERLNV